MTLRFGSIIVHKPADPNSEAENSSNVSSDDAEVAEIAETATLKYDKRPIRRSERQKRAMNKIKSLESRRSTSSLSSCGSNDISILRIMSTDKSPPLVRSHYSRQTEERGQDTKRSHRANNIHSADDMDSDCERLGFRVLTSGSRTTDKAISRRCVSAVPDTVSSFTTPFVPMINDDAAIKGLTKLLKNLNFTEKLRQQRAEQERLNIHRLPNHMREQLKHIYVY